MTATDFSQLGLVCPKSKGGGPHRLLREVSGVPVCEGCGHWFVNSDDLRRLFFEQDPVLIAALGTREGEVHQAREALKAAIDMVHTFESALSDKRTTTRGAEDETEADKARSAAYDLLCKEADEACARYVAAKGGGR